MLDHEAVRTFARYHLDALRIDHLRPTEGARHEFPGLRVLSLAVQRKGQQYARQADDDH